MLHTRYGDIHVNNVNFRKIIFNCIVRMHIHRLCKNNHNYEINIYVLEAIFNTKNIYKTNNMKNIKKYLPDNKISMFP